MLGAEHHDNALLLHIYEEVRLHACILGLLGGLTAPGCQHRVDMQNALWAHFVEQSAQVNWPRSGHGWHGQPNECPLPRCSSYMAPPVSHRPKENCLWRFEPSRGVSAAVFGKRHHECSGESEEPKPPPDRNGLRGKT